MAALKPYSGSLGQLANYAYLQCLADEVLDLKRLEECALRAVRREHLVKLEDLSLLSGLQAEYLCITARVKSGNKLWTL